jgi:uncharacterized membrane protein YgcG
MDRTPRVLRFTIDGRWTAEEMAAFISSVNDLYNVSLIQRVAAEDMPRWERAIYGRVVHGPPDFLPFIPHLIPPPDVLISRLSSLVMPDEKLQLRKIEFASPGFMDLAGLGQVIGHVKDFVIYIIERIFPPEAKTLANDEQRLKNDALRIHNAREFVSLYRDVYAEIQVREMANKVDERQDIIIRHIHEHRIMGVTLIDDQSDKGDKGDDDAGGAGGGGGGGKKKGGGGGGGGKKKPIRKFNLDD